jgi:hypothetical protein
MNLMVLTILFITSTILGLFFYYLIKLANKQAREGGFSKN